MLYAYPLRFSLETSGWDSSRSNDGDRGSKGKASSANAEFSSSLSAASFVM
jgi:hypothetical protein